MVRVMKIWGKIWGKAWGKAWVKTWLCLAVLACLLAGGFFGVQSAKSAERYVAELTIHSHSETLLSNMHAFLTIKNTTLSTKLNFLSYPLNPRDTLSVSIFGDSGHIDGLGGVYINYELASPTSVPVASFTIPITQSQFDLIASKTPAESYYEDGTADNWIDTDNLWHNCTTYTVKMWNMVAPEKYQVPPDFIGIDAPLWVKNEICKWNGHTYGTFTPPRTYEPSEVYYISKDRELIPKDCPKPVLSARLINDGSVELSWSSAVIQLLDGKRNINSYYVNITDEMADDTRGAYTHNTKRSLVIEGLKPNRNYSFQVRGAKISDLGKFPAETMPEKLLVYTGTRLYIDGTDMQMNLNAYFTREWAGAAGDLAYAYWCQDRIYGTNATDGRSYGRALVNTLFVLRDTPSDFMCIVPGVHIRTRGTGDTPPRSYIVADYDEVSIGVTYVDDDGIIRLTYYPWRMFYQFLNQQGGTAYAEHWNATGASDPKGTAAVSADAGRLHVSGWAMDASSLSQALTIRVEVGNEEAAFTTDLRRDDLPYDGCHGFDKYVLTSLSGRQRVKVIALNVGPGSDTVLFDGYVQIPATQTLAQPIMHIDAPSGSYVSDNNIEVSFWVAANQPVTGAYYRVNGMENSVGVASDQAVLSAQPDYAYGYRCRGAIDVSRLKPGYTYSITMVAVYQDGTSTQTSGSFAVTAAPVIKQPVLHIDHPTGTHSGFQDLEFSGWIASDTAVSYGFYEIASTDGTVAFQGGLTMADDRDVQAAYSSYRYTGRMRGVISLGSLRAHKDYTCKLAVTLVNGETYTTTKSFSVGAIYEYDTRHIVHVDAPADGRTYSGGNNIEISSWVVANEPITYCIYEIRRASDGAYLGQWSLDGQLEAPDLDAAYPNYAYRRRFRGVIEIASLESNTDYEFRIWYGIGRKGVQSSLGTARFRTGVISCEEYPVAYDLNGGSGRIAAQTKLQQQKLTLTGEIPVRTGYQFMGWARSRSADEAEFLPLDAYEQDEALKLYAVWKPAQLLPSELEAQTVEAGVPFGGSDAWFAFIPPRSGYYSFESSGTAKNVQLAILNEDGARITSTTGSGSFAVRANLDEGEKVYLRVGFADAGDRGSFDMTVRRCYTVVYMLGGAESLLAHRYFKEHGRDFAITGEAPAASRRITLLPNGGTLGETELVLSDRFRHFSTKADGTGTIYRLGQSYTANQNLALYPVWDGAVVTQLPTPTREHYRFDGWYLTTESGQKKISVGDVIHGDASLAAHWKADVLTIAFDPNGGTGEIAPVTVKSGESFTLPAEQPERFGYEFLGWAADPGAKWPAWRSGDACELESSMTLYAVWDAPTPIASDMRKDTHTFSMEASAEAEYYAFTPDEDTRFKLRAAGEPETKAIDVFTADGKAVGCEAETVDGSRLYKEYFLYAGQDYIIRVSCTGSAGDLASLMIFRGYAVTQMYYGLNMAVTYCYEDQTDFRLAEALASSVTLSFDPKGGTMQQTSCTYQIKQVAWCADPDGNGVWYVPGSTRVFTEPVTLYAIFDRAPSGEMEIPVREGYRFDGWYTNAYGAALGGVRISAGGLAQYLLYSGQNLFARWTEISQTEVSFSGGTGNVGSITVPVGESFTIPEEIPVRFGYRFLGWSTEPNAAKPSYAPGESYTATAPLALYAVWQAPALIPADTACGVYSVELGTASQLDTYYVFTPETSGRYRFRASGEPAHKQLTVYDANETPVPAVSTRTEEGWLEQEYQLESDTSYVIRYACAGSGGETASLSIARGHLVHFDDGAGNVETRICFEGQTDFILPVCTGLTAQVLFDPMGGSMEQTTRVCTLEHAQWNTAPDGSGTDYPPESAQSFHAPTVLYARYEDEALGWLETPVRFGYQFTGWYTAAEGGAPVTEDTPVSQLLDGGGRLYARWEELSGTVTIRFDTTYGSGYPDPVTLPRGAGFVIPDQVPTMDECRFDGWYTEEYGEGTLVTNGMVFTKDTLLYPKWILVSWRASPELQTPDVNGRTVTLRWKVYEQAQEYEVWEIQDNRMRRVAVVSGLTLDISRAAPGSHTYLVLPKNDGRPGSESNLVTAEVEHAVMRTPRRMRVIREGAFENNLQFTRVILGDEVETIGDYAFRGCSDLQSIYLPPSVKAIGTGAFDGCGQLVVACHAGSAAEAYCVEQALEYVLVDE